MPLIDPYWLDDPEAPYATFLRVIHTYLHPEASPDAEDVLHRLVTRTDVPKIVTFKKEFRDVLADPKILPEGALSTASEYEDGTDEAFLARLWHELYGDESPSAEQVQASPES